MKKINYILLFVFFITKIKKFIIIF